MITVKRYFDRSATSTLIWLLLFSLAAGHFSNILSDTQGNMLKKTQKNPKKTRSCKVLLRQVKFL